MLLVDTIAVTANDLKSPNVPTVMPDSAASNPPRIAVKLANVACGMGAIFSIAGIAITVHKISNWPGELTPTASKETPEYYFIILLIAVISTAFFVLGLTLRERLRVNLALVMISIGIPIICYEAYLEFSSPPTQLFMTVSDKFYDARTKIQVIDDLRANGIDAYPNVLGNQFLQTGLPSSAHRQTIYPFGGISDKTIVYCNESGQWAIFESDEYGFNNPKGLFAKGGVDIMLIGDSFAEGACVKPDETIASILRKSGFKTISLGKGGNGPLIELATLKEYAEPIEPKVVLWLHYAHDFDDLKEELFSPVVSEYLVDENFSQHLMSRQEEIDDALIHYVQRQYLEHKQVNKQNFAVKLSKNDKEEPENGNFDEAISLSRLTLIVKLTNLRQMIGLQLHLDPTSRLAINFKHILQMAKKKVSSWDGNFYIVYLHSRERYESGAEWPGYFREFVLRTASELEIPVIDIHKQVFEPHSNPLSLFPSGHGWHYKAEGYRLVTEVIAKRLRADSVLQ